MKSLFFATGFVLLLNAAVVLSTSPPMMEPRFLIPGIEADDFGYETQGSDCYITADDDFLCGGSCVSYSEGEVCYITITGKFICGGTCAAEPILY